MNRTFDDHASSYSEDVDAAIDFSGLSSDYFLARKAEIALELSAARPESVLDFGCGTGGISRFLEPHVESLVGTDTSALSLAQARYEVPGATFVQATSSSVPLPPRSCDLAIASCVFHHIDKGDRLATAARLRRLLVPGSPLVLFEHNPANPLTRLAVSRCEFDEDAVLLWPREARSVLKAAGFRDVRSSYLFFVPLDHPLVPRVERRLGWLPLGAQYVATGYA